MKIVCIGDSITYGYNIEPNKTWIEISKQRTGYEILNYGINGDTSIGMLNRFYKDVITQNPQYVHIMGGVNDLICIGKLNIVKSNIMEMIRQAQNANIIPILGISTGIVVDDIPYEWGLFTDYKRIEISLIEYETWLINFANSFKIDTINYRKALENCPYNNVKNLLFSDGLHPNELGAKYMAEAFIDYFRFIK